MSAFTEFFKVFRPNDYKISTWLLVGAIIQCLLTAPLPRTVSALIPILLLLYRFIRSYLIANGSLPNPAEDDITPGRQTWQIPSADGTMTKTGSQESIVLLVLAASWTHPNGHFSPGSEQVGVYFNAMWREATENREKYGFLGNTPGMVTEQGETRPDGSGEQRPDVKGAQTVYLSYWKTLDGLHKFAHGDTHMKGQLWWERTAMKQFKHLGVAHETYEIPAGNWENVFHNFRPFGISNAKYPITRTIDDATGNGEESVEWVSGLRSANGKDWKSMKARMGRKP